MKKRLVLIIGVISIVLIGGGIYINALKDNDQISSMDYSTTSGINKLDKNINRSGTKIIDGKTVYIRIGNTNTNNIQEFTPREYEMQVASQKNYEDYEGNIRERINKDKYSWIELKLQITKVDEAYVANGFYEWKTTSLDNINNQMSIEGTGVAVNYKKSFAQVCIPTLFASNERISRVYNQYSEGMFEEENGVVYEWPHTISEVAANNRKTNSYGVISVPISPINKDSLSDIVFQYGNNKCQVKLTNLKL
ncbi:MAG: hypothetical protein ACRDDY_08695 [Clostridium sp.]|uniref:hypothetical protein n=1 Tax=Clostridium sp. TaxID=1506 RepID=UPI003EE56D47